MIRIKGFGCFPALANNEANNINPIGEISLYSSSFASDRGIYKDADRPNSLLLTFSSLEEVSSTEINPIDPPSVIVALTLRIMEDLFALSVSGQLSDDREALMIYLQSNYEGAIKNITFGDIVSDGTNYLPNDLYWEGSSDTNPYSVRLWMADDAFRRQYDGFEIRTVPPTTNYDDFFGTVAEVQAIVDLLTTQAVLVKVDEVANRQPYTLPLTEMFDWVDPALATRKIQVPWTVVIYGDAGKNLDAIKEQLRKDILDNSQYTEDQWAKLFPDIFGATEFVFVPFWSHYAIPVDNLNGGVYSPSGNIKELVNVAQLCTKGSGYTEEHHASHLNIVGATYKSLQMTVLGGPMNREGIVEFADRWPDYLAVSTGSIDFDRMSESTRQMVRILNTLLITAETMTSQTNIPSGTLRTIRDNILYITASFERTQLLVASKMSVLEQVPAYNGSKPY